MQTNLSEDHSIDNRLSYSNNQPAVDRQLPKSVSESIQSTLLVQIPKNLIFVLSKGKKTKEEKRNFSFFSMQKYTLSCKNNKEKKRNKIN